LKSNVIEEIGKALGAGVEVVIDGRAWIAKPLSNLDYLNLNSFVGRSSDPAELAAVNGNALELFDPTTDSHILHVLWLSLRGDDPRLTPTQKANCETILTKAEVKAMLASPEVMPVFRRIAVASGIWPGESTEEKPVPNAPGQQSPKPSRKPSKKESPSSSSAADGQPSAS
jgi:hypothetical protein